jgi:organic radical activating enzyme
MHYELRRGRVLTWSLETHATDHCNLRCAQCCQLSPHMSERHLEPEVLRRDLERAREVLEPAVFKFTGGEPLLNPRIVELLEVAKASNIAPKLHVTTNGLLLRQMPDAFFDAVDSIKLSWYTSAPLPERVLAEVSERAQKHSVDLQVRAYDSFQELTPATTQPLSDAEAKRAHESCWIKVRCHLVYRGRFYTCSRPPKLQPYLERLGVHNELATLDGVDLDSPRLLDRLLAHLEQAEPLASCRHCLGSLGDWQAHRQLPRDVLTG